MDNGNAIKMTLRGDPALMRETNFRSYSQPLNRPRRRHFRIAMLPVLNEKEPFKF
jgi:hypothetical protein